MFAPKDAPTVKRGEEKKKENKKFLRRDRKTEEEKDPGVKQYGAVAKKDVKNVKKGVSRASDALPRLGFLALFKRRAKNIGRSFGRVSNPPAPRQVLRLVYRFGFEAVSADDNETTVEPDSVIRDWLDTQYALGNIPRSATVLALPLNGRIDDIATLGPDIDLTDTWHRYPDYFSEERRVELVVLGPELMSDTSVFYNATVGNIRVVGHSNTGDRTPIRYGDHDITLESLSKENVSNFILVQEGDPPARYLVSKEYVIEMLKPGGYSRWGWGPGVNETQKDRLRFFMEQIEREDVEDALPIFDVTQITAVALARGVLEALREEDGYSMTAERRETLRVAIEGGAQSMVGLNRELDGRGFELTPATAAILNYNRELIGRMVYGHLDYTDWRSEAVGRQVWQAIFMSARNIDAFPLIRPIIGVVYGGDVWRPANTSELRSIFDSATTAEPDERDEIWSKFAREFRAPQDTGVFDLEDSIKELIEDSDNLDAQQEFENNLIAGIYSANRTLSSGYGEVPLLGYAVDFRATAMVKILLLHGANVETAYSTQYAEEEGMEEDWRALTDALVSGQREMVHMLLAYTSGAYVDPMIENQPSALALIARDGDEELARRLIAEGADVNSNLGTSYQPIAYAVNGRNKEMFELLYLAGAEVVGFTGRDYVSEWIEEINARYNYSQRNAKRQELKRGLESFISYAKASIQYNDMEMFLSGGAPFNPNNYDTTTVIGVLRNNDDPRDNMTLLWHAVAAGKLPAVKALTKYPSNPDMNAIRMTELLLHSHPRVIQEYQGTWIMEDRYTSAHWPLLTLAALSGKNQIMEIMISLGCDTSAHIVLDALAAVENRFEQDTSIGTSMAERAPWEFILATLRELAVNEGDEMPVEAPIKTTAAELLLVPFEDFHV